MALEKPPGVEEMFFEIRDTLGELEMSLEEGYFPVLSIGVASLPLM